MADTPIEIERARRLGLMSTLLSMSTEDIEPSRLRELGVYGGAQGVWVDKARTSPAIGEADGVTVAILHTGRHYPDDLSQDGVIYHYPVTGRSAGRDRAEVQATKNAMRLDLPIFVILPGVRSKPRRVVKLGWVKDFDDTSRQFLILFGDVPPQYPRSPAADEPFVLEEERNTRTATINARIGQQRFRFQVLAQYGPKCAVCGICHPVLLKAAHIRGKRERGSDDWRNGIPLCSTHHDAFDAYLFGIDPTNGTLVCRPGVSTVQIGLREPFIAPLKATPHRDALDWRWEATLRTWRVGGGLEAVD
jgi:putative restriction endonuclease